MESIVKIIDNKSKGLPLSLEEINFFIKGVMNKSIKDYQTSALLMAIKIKGLSDQELIHYARALINSGKKLPLNNELVDKHSTGGIGDKTSITLLPILGSMGLKIFKISGRGLGFTGGTIDKLESIDGFETKLTIKQMNDMVDEIGISITSQTSDLTPADGKIYSLRDVTATVDSSPLIAASIISKKIASGAKNILIDVKIGSGSFINNIEDGKELARLMKLISNDFDRNLFVLFSSMEQPLGINVGNKNEVVEAIEFLKGNWSSDFSILIKKIATELHSKSKNVPLDISSKIYENVISTGKALSLQKIWFKKHKVINFNKEIKFEPKFNVIFNSDESGFVSFKNVKNFGNSLTELKANRKVKNETLDFDSGIKFLVKQGEKAKKGEPLFEVFSSNKISKLVIDSIKENYSFNKESKKLNVILGEVSW
ncbi:MAG: thymidine phosphorylase [Mycoplasmataceae bacterium]|nr:thymidine phosphorylase [Mycoplasmataceae bacterium]